MYFPHILQCTTDVRDQIPWPNHLKIKASETYAETFGVRGQLGTVHTETRPW